jgi:U3 small nucleolar RNA-associated protein 10
MSEVFDLVFDASESIPIEISDSNIWFRLEHPKVQCFMKFSVNFMT